MATKTKDNTHKAEAKDTMSSVVLVSEKPRGHNRSKGSKKISLPEFERLASEYMDEQQKMGLPPFLIGLAVKCDVDEDTVRRYGQTPGYAAVIKRVKQFGHNWLVNYVAAHKTAPIGQMFLLKAVFGYKEGASLDVTSDGKPLGVVMLPKR